MGVKRHKERYMYKNEDRGMELSKKHFHLAARLAAWLTGSATEEDHQEVDSWRSVSEANGRLAEELGEEGAYEANRELLERFPVREGWEKIRSRLGDVHPVRGRFRAGWKYAAAVLLLIGTGILFYQQVYRQPEVQTIRLARRIPAGQSGARLTLGNGKVVEITPQQEFRMAEQDGTLIRKDSAGIGYTQENEEGRTEVYNEMETLTGMEYMLTLADGTQVYLNAESRLKFPVAFRGKQRRVELQGEAYFRVTRDTARPFIVLVDQVEVKVLGTSFNVRSYRDEQDIVTTLVEGKVEINGLSLSPGEQALYGRKSADLRLREVDPAQYIAWHEGHFVFRNERLEDLMKTLARWYGVEYHFLDEEAKELRFGASFGRYESMEPILEMLKRTGLVEVLQTNRCFYFSVKK